MWLILHYNKRDVSQQLNPSEKVHQIIKKSFPNDWTTEVQLLSYPTSRKVLLVFFGTRREKYITMAT